jgi:hypothetical protein
MHRGSTRFALSVTIIPRLRRLRNRGTLITRDPSINDAGQLAEAAFSSRSIPVGTTDSAFTCLATGSRSWGTIPGGTSTPR